MAKAPCACARSLCQPLQSPTRGGIRPRRLKCIVLVSAAPPNRDQRWLNAGSRSSADGLSRRQLVLHSIAAPALMLAEAVDADAMTVVNSVLGAYGLPQLKQAAGFKLFDDFDFDYTFIYPRAWVGRRNRQRPGIYLSDFSTADKVTVEEVDAALAGLALRYDGSSNGRPPAEAAVAMAAVASLVNPGGIRDPEIGGDARLYMPAASSVRTSSEVIDGVRYTYMSFPSSTTTRSGYDIRRRNWAAAAVSKGKLFVLGASARRDLCNAEKEEMLKQIVASFRLR